MDTKLFDDKIAELKPQIDKAQNELDNDPTTIALRQYGEKGDTLRNLKQQLDDIQAKKDQAIALQSEIDEKSQQIADLNSTVIATPVVKVGS